MPPNPKDRLTALTEEVKRLVPELMELSFGCRVLCVQKHYKPLIFIRQYRRKSAADPSYRYVNMSVLCEEDDEIYHLNRDYYKNIEVLGHPITLEHVRVALRRSERFLYDEIVDQNRALNEVNAWWRDLQPFESQIPVHTFLSNYLLK